MNATANPPCRNHRFLNIVKFSVSVLTICACFSACSRTDQKTAAGPPEKVTIAFAALTETALAQVAQLGGYYREEGLDVTARLHPYGKLALRDVLEGRADFATVAETPAMLAIMNGEKISVIATIFRSRKNHAIIARKDAGIHFPQDLKGKKIAATKGITSDFFMDGFLAVRGISRKELTVVNLKPEELQKAIVNGEVAAVSTFNPFLSQTQKILGDRGITFYDEDIYTATFNVVATQEFIRTNPDKVKRMLRALLKAEKLVRDHPAEAQKMVAQFTGIAPGIVGETWGIGSIDLTLSQSLILSLEDESQWAIRNGITKVRNIPNYLDYIYSDGLKSVKPEAVMILR
ncbi:MAG: NrtA/SsuA/CpmA family ABC transporter substrate-binding protein [Desulfuromonadaceae bacterium]